MTESTLTYRPVGRSGFQCELVTSAGSRTSVTGTKDDDRPKPTGDKALRRNPTLVASLWAYGKHELLYRRARLEEKRKSHRRAADIHAELALAIADYSDNLGSVSREGWCSCCFKQTEHVGVEIRALMPYAYLCRNCGAATTPCLAPKCANMADRGTGSVRLPHYCAEHRHDIRGFEKMTAQVANLDGVDDWLTFEKRNLAAATKIAAVSTATAVVIVPGAFLTAPAIGAAIGGSVLGGGLSGAAATSHGLAMLGLGSVAAGGFGMAGGTAVVIATGAALGGTLGAATTSAYVRDDKSFGIARLRTGRGTPVLLASGFLTENDDGWGSWEQIITERYPHAPVYRVHWGSKELKAFGTLATSGAGKAVTAKLVALAARRGSVRAAGKVPYVGTLLLAQEVVANPWSIAKRRAGMTGAALADILTRTKTKSFVLVGHSLGARVMVTTAQALGTRSGTPKLESVHLLGAAVGAKGDWRTLNESVTEGVWNYRSENDSVLKYLYRNLQLGQHAAGVVGFRSGFPRINDQNVSKTVGSHSAYFEGVQLK